MTITRDFLPILKGIDLTTKRLPLLSATTNRPGPTIWLTAAIHGNEVTGTAVIQSLFKRLEQYPLEKGTLHAFPILNTSGFETISRHDTFDEEDLNRHFGGTDQGSTTERLASLILSHILATKPDYLIDLHTDSMNSIAYAIVDRPATLKTTTPVLKAIDLAQTLDLAWAIDTDATAGYPLEHCLTGQLVSRGIPAITLELGGPMVVMDEFRKTGLEAIWRFLATLKLVPGSTSALPTQSPHQVYVFKEKIRTQSTGIIEYRVKPGDKITQGKLLGKIRNVFGETIEVIRSPSTGVLFSHEDQSVTFPGQALFPPAVASSLESALA